MNALPRIYLDNAATSWPKPAGVYAAVDRYQRELGAPAGRSAYSEAGEVQQQVNAARRGVAQLIGCGDPSRVVFTFNGTDSLNLALHGLLRPGDHVVTTVCEHNSVLRPLKQLEQQRGVAVSRVKCGPNGIVSLDDLAAAFRPETRLLAIIHASNVTGALQPVVEAAELARRHAALVLVDAAQSLGHVPVDVGELGADLLAAPGHKGLLGPLGTGLLYVSPGVEEQLESLRQGGTGTASEQETQPASLPDKYEAGNHNVPGLMGLAAGVGFLLERSIEANRQHEQELTERLLAGVANCAGVNVYGPADASRQVGVVSLTMAGFDPQELASLLDTAYGIQTRAGLHCAPWMHRSLGTADAGGTLRFSVGPFTTPTEIDTAAGAIAEIAASASV